MTTRFKKNRKKRGPVSDGHGCIGKHWKHSVVGGTLEECTTTASFGKVGMRYFHCLRNKFHCPAINVDRLWSLIPEVIKDAAIASDGSSAPLIDVPQFKYFEVLDKGILPQDRPVVVKAKLVSKIAEKKIKAAGGAIVLTT